MRDKNLLNSITLAASVLVSFQLSPATNAEDMIFGSQSSTWKITKDGETKDGASTKPVESTPKPPQQKRAVRPAMKWTPVNPASLNFGSGGWSPAPTFDTGTARQPGKSGGAAVKFTKSKSLDKLDSSSNEYKAIKLSDEAESFSDKSDYKKAFELMEQSVKLDPSSAEAWYNKGLIAQRIDKWKESLSDFEKAQQLRPDLSNKCSIEIARASAELGDKDKAATSLWTLRSKIRNDQALERKIGGLLVEIGDERAISNSTILASATERELQGGIQQLSKEGKTTELIELCGQLSKRGQNARNESYTAYYLLKANKFAEALAAYKRADELNPSDGAALRGIMACATQLGLLEEVQSAQKEYVKRFPSDERSKKYQDQITYYEKDFNKTRDREKASEGASNPAGSRVSSASVSATGDVPHFAKSNMPLKVYIPDFEASTESWQAAPDKSVDYMGTIHKSLDDWADASGRKVTFTTVNSPDDANISVEWLDDSTKMEHSFAAGTTGIATNSRGQRRHHLKLLVPTKASSSNAGEFYETSVHEFGHALGLSHSSDPSDIMYFSEVISSETRHLSDNDRKRINELYK